MSKEKSHLIIGIDLGSSTLKMCAVLHHPYGELSPEILDLVELKSEAIHKGDILDEEILARDINRALNQFSEKVLNRKSKTLIVALNVAGLGSVTNSGQVLMASINNEITKSDLERLEKDASLAVASIKNKSIIFTSAIRYRLDQNEISGNPLSLVGKKLEGKFLFAYTNTTYLNKIETVFNKLALDFEDLEVGIVAESIPLLNSRQRIAGTVLINFGHSTTSFIVFENNRPLMISVLGLGSDDITKDLALGLQISLEEAESLKLNKSELSYSKRKLEDIIEARVEYICEKINLELDKIRRRELLPGGVILTGGGSKLPGIDLLFKKYLKLPVKLAEKEIREFSENQVLDPVYARAYGVTFLAPTISNDYKVSKFFSQIFRNFLNFFKKLLP